MKRICTILLSLIMMLALCACGNDQNASNTGNNIAKYDTFEISSKSLSKGKWDNDISNTDKGINVSPELHWDKVEGATCYQIYMVDTSMQYFIHWKACNVTETTLKEGWAQKDYVGPYPPKGGKHTYDIYVFATKNEVERLKGSVNGQNAKFPSFIEEIDIDKDGNTGNVISCGYLSGTFKN